HRFLTRASLVAAALALILVAATAATGAGEARDRAPNKSRAIHKAGDKAPNTTATPSDVAPSSFTGGMQHGPMEGHLPGSSANVELIGELEPTDEFDDIVPGQIADLAVGGGFAYLNSWNEPTCTKGGTYVVDIRNPRDPKEVDFIPALTGNYHGEGADLLSVDTKYFTGKLFAVNNEHGTCPDVDTTIGGGFDLYDVSNPNNPRTLVQGWGDQGGEGRMNGSQPSNTYHSVFMWKDEGNVYLVGTDNEEFADVDIWDITNPRKPKPVAEYDLAAEFPQILQTAVFPRLNEVFNHDMVVKQIGGRQVMLDSYWDAGYVMLDVENPAKATYIGDTDFADEDPLVAGVSPPEGNAHEAEFSHDSTYFLGADEDFNPYRSDKFFVDDQERPAVEVGGGTSPAALPDQTLSGKVVYGGYGCPADPTVLPLADDYTAEELGLQPGDEKILLMQRGPTGDPSADYNGNGDLTDDACFPGEKAAKAFDAGWDAIVLVNRHLGSDDSTGVPFCGSGAFEADKPMVTICTTHAAYHELFGTPPEFTIPYSPGDAPAIGAVSVRRVRATSIFDGWGYLNLFRRSAGKVERVDSYAIPEALDPAFAFGFGDLSIHEIATDPGRNIAYSSYYAGGMRVFSFGSAGIEEVGHYIDAEGNNFWGVETFVPAHAAAGDLEGKRLFAGSDRDHGIFIFRYTGG
ncbi:MAG TPA: hypothetical protein VF065_07360, partial [Ilumatobacter sp.]